MLHVDVTVEVFPLFRHAHPHQFGKLSYLLGRGHRDSQGLGSRAGIDRSLAQSNAGSYPDFIDAIQQGHKRVMAARSA
jgi:hypothetical protein